MGCQETSGAGPTPSPGREVPLIAAPSSHPQLKTPPSVPLPPRGSYRLPRNPGGDSFNPPDGVSTPCVWPLRPHPWPIPSPAGSSLSRRKAERSAPSPRAAGHGGQVPPSPGSWDSGPRGTRHQPLPSNSSPRPNSTGASRAWVGCVPPSRREAHFSALNPKGRAAVPSVPRNAQLGHWDGRRRPRCVPGLFAESGWNSGVRARRSPRAGVPTPPPGLRP